MSVTIENSVQNSGRGHKRSADAAEIEIDVDAPEPPSKKALRKARKSKTTVPESAAEGHSVEPSPSSQTTSTEKGKRSQHGIWIGNLAFTTTKDDLVNFLTRSNPDVIRKDQITRVHLPLGTPKFGKPNNKGFAYIDFADEGALLAALDLTESLLSGRRVLIKNAKSFEGRPEVAKNKEVPGNPPSKRIFVGNLDFDTTVDEIEAHFGVCGQIAHTHMATFEDSGKCKGFAWIEFDQLSSAEAAMRGWIETDADEDEEADVPHAGSRKQRRWLQKIRGRKLRMEYAEDKATRYQKRFGKGSKGESAASGMAQQVEQSEPIQEVSEETRTERGPRLKTEEKSPKKARSGGKYAEETVQRLTGAIVESRGQKIVF